MGSPFVRQVRRPPFAYRLARGLRRLSSVVLVLLMLYLATVAYSTYALAQSGPPAGSYTAGFVANDSLAVQGEFSIANPGLYPVEGLALTLRVLNSSGGFLGLVRSGSVTLAPGGTTTFPVAVYVPITPSSAAASLLVTDQVLSVGVWGNATYAYLFPVSIHFVQNRWWGAPFNGFRASAGVPSVSGGNVVVPITISFSNHAPLTETGALTLILRSSGGAPCGSTTFVLNVPSNSTFDQTQNVALASGCSISGGSAVATYTSGGTTIVLPPEAIP